MGELGVTAGGYAEVLAFVRSWDARTKDVLLGTLRKLKVGDTKDLEKSLRTAIIERGEGMLRWELAFQTVGRFVDMGSGRGAKMGKPTSPGKRTDDYGLAFRARRTKGKDRKPKKWYSRPAYARLSALQGAVATVMTEMAVNGVRTADAFGSKVSGKSFVAGQYSV